VVSGERPASYTRVMPVRTRTPLFIGALAAVILTSCTHGTVPVASPSSTMDLPASPSQVALPSMTTAPSSASASATSRSGRPSSSPGASTSSPSIHNGQARLTRPLHLPVLHPGQACPVSRGTPTHSSDFTGSALGVGPVHPIATGNEDLSSNTHAPGWLAIKSLWLSDPQYQGPSSQAPTAPTQGPCVWIHSLQFRR
jgi:hypothetical protein